MNIVKELESVLKQSTFMGDRDKVGVNLAVNAILDRIDELGFDIVDKEKEVEEKLCYADEYLGISTNGLFGNGCY